MVKINRREDGQVGPGPPSTNSGVRVAKCEMGKMKMRARGFGVVVLNRRTSSRPCFNRLRGMQHSTLNALVHY